MFKRISMVTLLTLATLGLLPFPTPTAGAHYRHAVRPIPWCRTHQRYHHHRRHKHYGKKHFIAYRQVPPAKHCFWSHGHRYCHWDD